MPRGGEVCEVAGAGGALSGRFAFAVAGAGGGVVVVGACGRARGRVKVFTSHEIALSDLDGQTPVGVGSTCRGCLLLRTLDRRGRVSQAGHGMSSTLV